MSNAIASLADYQDWVNTLKQWGPNFSDKITKNLPPMGKAVHRWNRQLADNCQVFNIALWNGNFSKWPAARVQPEGAKLRVRRGI